MASKYLNDILSVPEIAAVLARQRILEPPPAIPPQPPASADVPGVPPPGAPAEPPQPGFWDRLKAAAPRMIQAGIAAAATPAQYGGGAVDLFRGMQAAQGELERRDLMAYEIARQREEDARQQARTEAMNRASDAAARAHEAQARYYDSRASAREPATLEQALTAAYLEETDPSRKTELYNQILRLKGRSPGDEAPYREVGNGMAITKSGQLVVIDPQKAMARRLEVIRQMQMAAPDPKSGARPAELSDADVLARMTPEQRAYYMTGEWPEPGGGGRSMTEWQARFLAAQGDPIARSMLDQRAREAEAGRAATDARARRAQKMRAEQEYLDELARAEAWYSGERAKLDKTLRPDAAVGPTGGPIVDPNNRQAMAEAWARYNEAHRALVEQLAQRKNAAHAKAQAAYAAIDPENFQPSPGYGPDAMPLGRVTDPTAADYLKRRGLK